VPGPDDGTKVDTEARPPEPVNTRGPEICPILSPDGRYLFLNSGRAGNENNFWVEASFLEELR
jgi:hypothetical protein